MVLACSIFDYITVSIVNDAGTPVDESLSSLRIILTMPSLATLVTLTMKLTSSHEEGEELCHSWQTSTLLHLRGVRISSVSNVKCVILFLTSSYYQASRFPFASSTLPLASMAPAEEVPLEVRAAQKQFQLARRRSIEGQADDATFGAALISC